MSKKQAPYRHSDGSGCWTAQCSKRLSLNDASKALDKAQLAHQANVNPWLVQIANEGNYDAAPPPHVKATLKLLKKAQKNFDEALERENKERLKRQPNILARDDPRFLQTLKNKGY